MKLGNGWHLAYCTNIHRGESWEQTFQTLKDYTLRVKRNVCSKGRYAIGLRLGHNAANELDQPDNLNTFKKWLDDNDCYVFTVNGFPYGTFHGARVKEDVYRPDWTDPARVDYTKLLFRLLREISPDECGASVSTVPCSYKEFIHDQSQIDQMKNNLWDVVEYIDELQQSTGRDFHLGLEPEPLCYLETSTEAVDFINSMRDMRKGDNRIDRCLGVNYDTCHLAIEFEEPHDVIQRFESNNIRISKIHLSSALKVIPTTERLEKLQAFDDPVYFHQVISKNTSTGHLKRIKDLDLALENAKIEKPAKDEEWRIHFHIPLHSETNALFSSTSDHIEKLLDILANKPELCDHFEMETYTWEVLPDAIKQKDVVDQLTNEYNWTFDQLTKRKIITSR